MPINMKLGKGGGPVGGARAPQGHSPTFPCLLSLECQKRGFNPIFHGWATPDGGFKCSVSVNGTIVHDNHSYDTAIEAKDSIAEKALKVARKLPYQKPANKSGTMNDHHGPARAKSEDREIKSENSDGRDPTPVNKPDRRRDAGRHPDQPSLSYLPDYYKGPGFAALQNAKHRRAPGPSHNDDCRTLMNSVRALFGDQNGPDERILNDPVASQAYLQGFALGGRAAVSARHRPAGNTQRLSRGRRPDGVRLHPGSGFFDRRERSPAPFSTRGHRERSPLPRQVSSKSN